MTQDVLISLTGFQYIQSADEPEPVEVMTSARYYFKNGQHYLVYDEVTEGFEQKTANIIRFSADRMMVHKKGLINVEMNFEKDQNTMAAYVTPYGVFDMGIQATCFRLKESEDLIEYQVDYAMSMDAGFVADCQIFIKIAAKKPKE